jgi:hypothetical protein
MRAMVLLKATDDSEEGFLPTAEAMGRFNRELVNAGSMFIADDFKPSSVGMQTLGAFQ